MSSKIYHIKRNQPGAGFVILRLEITDTGVIGMLERAAKAEGHTLDVAATRWLSDALNAAGYRRSRRKKK